ncbi:MAG: hypothetical protein CMH57_14005 [Myxococcales bacterium]|nr:hypothetical protein [Myxococcales bacterium]
MPTRLLQRLVIAAWLSSLAPMVFAEAVHAQPTSPERKTQPGELRVIVFDAERTGPAAGVRIIISGVSGGSVTNPDGAATLVLPVGTYDVELGGGAGFPWVQLRGVPIEPRAVTEVVATLRRDGLPPRVDVEAGRAMVLVAPEVDANAPKGRLTGRVTLEKKGTPIVGARVFVRGQPVEATTDRSGRFELELPIGAHDLTVIAPEYATASLSQVEVTEEEVAEVQLEMAPVAVELEEYVVLVPRIEGSSTALLEERRESGVVSDMLGAEEMSKTGASDAASALSRVTGVTIVDGKFVFVRGLGDRYSSTLLDGATLPSPEPERRVVPLDLFPTGVLESVVIQKTYSPDMPGEFGGGVVDLRTRGIPGAFVFNVSLSGGVTTGTTLASGLSSPGGSTDWLGFDDGTRALPSEIEAAASECELVLANRFSDCGFTPQELEGFGESLPNTWETTRETLPPNFGLGVTVGDRFEFTDKLSAGFLFGGNYGNAWSRTDRAFNRYLFPEGGEPVSADSYDIEFVENEITLGGLLTAGVDYGEDHKLRLTSLLARITTNSNQLRDGFDDDVMAPVRLTRRRWVERELLHNQLRGEHVLESVGGLGVNWHVAYSQADLSEPDRRDDRYDFEAGDEEGEGVYLLPVRPDSNQRLFGALQDVNQDARLELVIPYAWWDDLEGDVKVGASTIFRDRDVSVRRFNYTGGPPGSERGRPPEELFTDALIGPDEGQFQLSEFSRDNDSYVAELTILGAWMMVDAPLTPSLRLIGGARVEQADQRVASYPPLDREEPTEESELSHLDVMPAATLSWSFLDGMIARASVARTVSRPSFRELSEALFVDINGQFFRGNAELERGQITHYDLRWEWYPSELESVTLAAFYKDFDQPVEQILEASTENTITFVNIDSARNYGLELDLRRTLGFIDEELVDFFIAANATLVTSSVTLPEGGLQTNDERPLQGQSPYVFNVQAGYDDVDRGTSVIALYNVAGPRIESAGSNNAPDSTREPFHQLDFVVRQRLRAGFALSFKGTNLLDSSVTIKQGDVVQQQWRKGRSFSLGLGWSY